MTRHSGTSGLAHLVKELTGIDLNHETLATLLEQCKNLSDSKSILSSTDIIRLLNREKITDSETWEMITVHEVREGEELSLHIKIKNSKSESLTLDARGNTLWESIAEKFTTLFGYGIKCEEYSFSLVGSSHRQTGRFYLCASYNGRLYHEELLGCNEAALCIEAYLDIVNSIICRESGVKSSPRPPLFENV